MRRASLALLFLCAGCPHPGGDDAGVDAGSAPSVTSVDPTHGPIAGGTLVTVNGSSFVSGATVVFGTAAATSVTFVSSRKLTAVSPAAPEGRASVTVVNPDGRQGTLPAAFLFEGTTTGTIADALALNPPNATDSSGANPLLLTVKGQVKVPGVTDVAGAPAGVRAQVGFAPEGTTTLAWTDAPWLEDADLYDTFQGPVTVPAPQGMEVRTYVLGVRFSVDNGATWVEGDHDGSINGLQESQRPRVTVSRPPITWCKLGGEQIAPPDSLDLRIGQPGPTIYGQVYAPGLTDKPDAGAGIMGELGVGDAGLDPSLWAWVPATYNHDTASGANDEFMAVLPTSAELAGDKHFAFRFGISGGPWRYCDSDGLATGGFTDDQAGRLHLSSVGIDECRLQFPLTLMSRQGVVAGTVYGRVLARSVTEAAGAGTGIEAQLGHGPLPALPTDPSWVWQSAAFNTDVAGGQDEYQAELVGPAPGNYAYAYRFRYQGGPWSYCDSDPSDGMLQASQLGALTAVSATFKAISACRLQFVSSSNVASGAQVTAYGRAIVPGFSEAAGATVGLVGQVGVGTAGSNASSDPAWGWRAATYNLDTDAGDEFVATFTPAYTGTRAVSFRFAVEDGGWVYCDQNGSDVNGYEVAQQWGLTVGRPAIEFCNTQFPPAADAGTLIYGQIYVPGVTPNAAAPITAELGYGKKIEDPGVASSWTWAPASFNTTCTASSCATNNEYQAVLTAPADAGWYAFRFTYNGNVCYGDLDGAGSIVGGFNGETAGGAENLGVVTR